MLNYVFKWKKWHTYNYDIEMKISHMPTCGWIWTLIEKKGKKIHCTNLHVHSFLIWIFILNQLFVCSYVIYLFIDLFVYLFLYLFINLLIYLFVYLSIPYYSIIHFHAYSLYIGLISVLEVKTPRVKTLVHCNHA